MLYFENDYCEGAHPAILQKLTETNFEKVSGYGTDPYCASAREKIRAACACPEADVQFISGGTQSNAIVIASMLQRWQGVVAAATGHVAGHEAGAIEYTGHKVITLPQHNGKLDAAELRALVATILQKLTETNFEKVSGYGTDPYCASAREKIRAACACPEADVQFISGGTQSNAIVIASMLQRWQGVVAAATGHVAGHEAGAIEYTGHKVITLPQHNGKLDAAELRALVATFYADDNHDHMVFPGMVYISHPTEYGTLYTKAELEALHAVCQEYKMPLFLDGARLGYGLAAEGTDVTLADLARLTDVFYIGGTKVGALCGEAVVFPHGAPAHFMTMVKQQGALLAKGRLLGIQFDVLFTDGLYFSISKNAIATANRLKKGFAEKGYRFFMDSPTNQIFLVLENTQLAALEGKAKFGFWEKFDDTHTVVRIATSWATRMDEVEALIDLM